MRHQRPAKTIVLRLKLPLHGPGQQRNCPSTLAVARPPTSDLDTNHVQENAAIAMPLRLD